MCDTLPDSLITPKPPKPPHCHIDPHMSVPELVPYAPRSHFRLTEKAEIVETGDMQRKET